MVEGPPPLVLSQRQITLWGDRDQNALSTLLARAVRVKQTGDDDTPPGLCGVGHLLQRDFPTGAAAGGIVSTPQRVQLGV